MVGYFCEPVERSYVIFLCPSQVAQTPTHFSRVEQGVAAWERGVWQHGREGCGSMGERDVAA